MNLPKFTREDLGERCPKYVNIAFTIYRGEGLPIGVYEGTPGIYYPVVFYGEYNGPRFQDPYDDPQRCHIAWQMYYVQSMRQMLQYYSLSDLYNQNMAQGIRVVIEKVEEDIQQGRESVF